MATLSAKKENLRNVTSAVGVWHHLNWAITKMLVTGCFSSFVLRPGDVSKRSILYAVWAFRWGTRSNDILMQHLRRVCWSVLLLICPWLCGHSIVRGKRLRGLNAWVIAVFLLLAVSLLVLLFTVSEVAGSSACTDIVSDTRNTMVMVLPSLSMDARPSTGRQHSNLSRICGQHQRISHLQLLHATVWKVY